MRRGPLLAVAVLVLAPIAVAGGPEPGKAGAEFSLTGPDGKETGTYDFSSEVLPIGVVTSDSQSASMELLAYGKDAKSLITEEPVPMEMPPGMTSPPGPGMMPPGMAPPAR